MKSKKIFEATEFKDIREIIYNSAEKYSDNIAFTIKHQENKKVEYENITYKKLLEDVNAFGTSLFKLGAKTERVAIIGKNRYEWTVAHLANLLGGIVSVPLDKDLQYQELETSLIRSKAKIIVFDEKLKDTIEEIKEKGNTELKEFICMSEGCGFKSVRELIKQGNKELKKDKEYINVKIDENKMNILLFTSGTTSKSKAVMLSQKNIASNIYGMQLCEDIRSTDTNIAFLPFHHIFGSTCMIIMLASGVKTVFPDGLRYIKQNLVEYKVTVFVGVPVLIEAIYKAIMKEVDKQGKTKLINTALKISNFLMKLHIDVRRKIFKQIIDALGGKLRFLISGGAPADPMISKKFNNLGIKVVQGYGLTETSPVVAAEDDYHMKVGSIGTPLPNVEVEIINKDENGIGEITVKGPNVMLGYYEMPEETKEVLKDGWFHTGDLAYMDKEGFIFITGRSKNMIVLKNGKKIFPEEIETIVNRLDLVSECMVFGKPDKHDKNDITLAVKIVYDKEVANEKYAGKTEDELFAILWSQIKDINTSFPRYKHIKKLILSSEELIKTTTKKIKRQENLDEIERTGN